MTAKRLEIFVIVSIIGIIGIIYAFTQTPAPRNQQQATENQNQTVNEVTTRPFEYKGEDGKNAFELLKAKHNVESKHYDFGDMVISIDGITPNSDHFWAMYVNGEFSQVGASEYITKSSDTIHWQLDSINP